MAIEPNNEGKALAFVRWILDQAVDGVPPLCSAHDLATEYLIDESYPDDQERIEALINWETSKNFTSGFITGLGGLLVLPVTIPAALGASWIIQARMAAAIAIISGLDIKSDRVRTLVLLSLFGDAVKEVLKEVGIKVGNAVTAKIIQQVPGKVLIEINKKIGFRLLTKAGEKGILNLAKMVPIAGGLIGGGFDAFACRLVGRTAKMLFFQPKEFKVECPGPECNAVLLIEANVEVECPDCGTEFSYNAKTQNCYWEYAPKEVGCNFCEGGIYVQGTGNYQCPECRKYNHFIREGNRIFTSD